MQTEQTAFLPKVFFLLCFLLASGQSLAGGPLYVSDAGELGHWPDGLTLSVESGSCGNLSNAEMLAILEEAADAWQNQSEVDLQITLQDVLPEIDVNNLTDYIPAGSNNSINIALNSDGIVPVIFDDDGEITDAIFGVSSKFGVLGFASASNASDDFEFSDGYMILNCRCLQNHPTESDCDEIFEGLSVSLEIFESTLVHEMGHLLGLDHSVANEDLTSSNNPDDWPYISIMYPLSFDTNTPFAITQDDVVALGTLYPSTALETDYCLVTGTLLDLDGEDLYCANVVATTDDVADTITFVTGAFDDTAVITSSGLVDLSDSCSENCGDFQLYLPTQKDYTLSITELDPNFTNGSSVGPCRSEQAANVTAQSNLATITSEDCVAGQTLDLGEIQTNSPHRVSSDSGGCTLTQKSSPNSKVAFWLLVPFVLFLLRLQKSSVRFL